MAKKRTFIIGLDGVPYRLIQELSENGTMPHVRMLMNDGVFRQMESSIPEVSSVAWASIITGSNPGTHGIFGFTDLAPGTYKLIFPNFNTIKSDPFWQQDTTKRRVIINVPTTYPAKELNGVLIAGFVALNLEKATYPASLVPQLKNMDYRIDIDLQRASKSTIFLLEELSRTLQARIAVCRYLWQSEKWDTFMLVFTGTDRLMHFLWHAYEDEAHPHHAAFMHYFHEVDEAIGEIMRNMEQDDSIILLSDHGFERLDRDVYINLILKQHGLLKFRNEPPSSLEDISEGTKAFALDPARIYLNLENKYPRGCVKPQEQESVLRELESIFASLYYNAKKVIKKCYRREEIYKGQFMHQAPDIVLLGNEGFNLRGSIEAEQALDNGTLTGKHSQSDAFLLIQGNSDKIALPEKLRVSDVVDIMNKLHDEPGSSVTGFGLTG